MCLGLLAVVLGRGEGVRLTVVELNALSFEIGLNWEDDGVILVVRCTVYTSKGVDAGKLMDESVKITPEFHSAVPWLERKPDFCQSP